MKSDAAALALFGRLAATPRAAGSAEEGGMRRACAEFLQARGFETREVRFSYSNLPGRWGVPIVGAIWLAGALAAIYAGAYPLREHAAIVAFALVAAGWVTSLALSLSVTAGRVGRSESVNLVATRGIEPLIWLCAHLDTKSQAVSTLVRSAALMAAGASAMVLVILYMAGRLTGGEPGTAWLVAGTVLAAGAGVMMICVVGNSSPGAADNASGVAAVLATASSTGKEPLGVVLTSAEELGLAGAKAWAVSAATDGRQAPRAIINCDTLDDEGVMRCVVHNRRDSGLVAELVAAGAAADIPVRVTRHTPGIMVDSAALAASGLPAVTLSRVTLSTLRRIHTSRDTADRLSGDGIEQAVALMSGFVREHA
ncbi:hypothetical protein BH23GEM2_BH23GEM2_10450 [soil metagenome]